MSKIQKKICQLKIVLKGIRPPIWRRFLVVNTITLQELHEIIQIVMGWENSHLHQFIANGQYYGEPDPEEYFRKILDERKYKVGHILKKEKDTVIYEYDFGDGWEHKITLEKFLPYNSSTRLPICLKGKRACPPEDVGGVWGYYNFLDGLNDPDHPEHEEYKDWIGDDFDPERFDLDEVNELLLKYCSSHFSPK